MATDNVLEILKQALLLERRGQAFYQKVAEHTDDEAVRDFFETMSEEEQKHMQLLAEQYTAYQQQHKFVPGDYDENETSQVASKVLTQEVQAKIAAAGFEAAAITAAISMEERAVKLYAESALTATDPVARDLYQWLSSWEQEHLNVLLDIDNALMEKIWFDNKFWPF